MIKHVTKKNGPRPERIIALAVFSALFVAAIVTGLVYAYRALAEIWREQCRVTDMELDVVISPAKIIPQDVLKDPRRLTTSRNTGPSCAPICSNASPTCATSESSAACQTA